MWQGQGNREKYDKITVQLRHSKQKGPEVRPIFLTFIQAVTHRGLGHFHGRCLQRQLAFLCGWIYSLLY